MKTYKQYCPIARTSEILAERWTPLIVRNLMFGLDTFTDLSRGVPAMSRSMLIKRLDQLERANIITKTEKDNGHGHRYELTDAGRDLTGIILQMAEWGDRWVEITAEHSDPGVALWFWAQVQMSDLGLPVERTVVAFSFPDQPPSNRHYWFLCDDSEIEMCYSDPGGPIDLHVTAESLAFVNWHYGTLEWTQAVNDGRIIVSGNRELARALPTWNTHAPVLAR
ncbi:MAG: helix-turn-helix domain-containing protein [Actinomycetota bacterium]